MTVAQIMIWNLADSPTTIEEVRAQLPPLPEGSHWIANEPEERFGVIALSDDPPELESLRVLIGKEPDIAEEYDLLDV